MHSLVSKGAMKMNSAHHIFKGNRDQVCNATFQVGVMLEYMLHVLNVKSARDSK